MSIYRIYPWSSSGLILKHAPNPWRNPIMDFHGSVSSKCSRLVVHIQRCVANQLRNSSSSRWFGSSSAIFSRWFGPVEKCCCRTLPSPTHKRLRDNPSHPGHLQNGDVQNQSATLFLVVRTSTACHHSPKKSIKYLQSIATNTLESHNILPFFCVLVSSHQATHPMTWTHCQVRLVYHPTWCHGCHESHL